MKTEVKNCWMLDQGDIFANMLEPIKYILSKKRIVLASGSPRRKTILQNIGLNFDVILSTFEENLNKNDFTLPSDYVLETARLKVMDVAQKLTHEKSQFDIIIGCDTIVTMGGKINEKPSDKVNAFEMLSSFRGRLHTVITGVVVVTHKDLSHPTSVQDGDYNVTSFHENTHVKFADVSDEVLRAYIETGEPMDKAGGYGIQASGGTLIEGIQGDYFNVMGFPLHRFARTLSEMFSE